MTATIGAGLIGWRLRRRAGADTPGGEEEGLRPSERPLACLWPRRTLFVVLVVVPLVIPSDRTQDVPARYGAPHPGLRHPLLYPPVTLVP